MKKLSNRQQNILSFIENEVNTKGYPPSVREIAKAVGLASSSTVHGHLERLEKRGYLRRDPTKPRAIELLDPSGIEREKTPVAHIPLIGKVTAGQPITAIENIEEYVPVPDTFSSSHDSLFMLEIEGNSMIDAGILNGDYVIVEKKQTAENGEIIVAMTDENEATVKRFYKEETLIRLQPENENMAPIYLDDVTILGKVVGVFRTM